MKLLDRLFHFVETLPTSDRMILKIFATLSFCTLLWALVTWSTGATIAIPERGGSLTEGVIGTPRFINPVLAVTTADKDLTSLIFAGLMRLGPDGALVPNMAESVTVSDDGLTYNVILKDGLTFHDDTPVTVDDIIFTVGEVQDPMIKSPLRGNWEGVTIERIGDKELNFVLTQAYAPFEENLTLGILPRHIWENATAEEIPFSQYNSEPIGSGPYMKDSIGRDEAGIPRSYTLKPFTHYHTTTPHIETLILHFYPNESELVSALNKGAVESVAGLTPDALTTFFNAPKNKADYTLYKTPLPKTFALFFNQNENRVLRDNAVRRALDIAIDREAMVREVLGGYGMPIDGPIPPGFGLDNTYTATTSSFSRIDAAKDILRQGGWKLNEMTGLWEKKDGTETRELKFGIATINTPVFEATAESLRNTWSELGVPVDIKKFEQSDLTQTVIRPRKYDTLLFGTNVGRELDFYSFWHSSQRNDPGLNVALYANLTTDSALADIRTKTLFAERKSPYERFATEMHADTPAIFLYVPEFTYIAPSRIQNVSIQAIGASSERFAHIEEWYTETESVWPPFTEKP